MFELKPDFEDVRKRFEAWWNCAIIDRPLVSIPFAKPKAACRDLPRKEYANIRDRWMDTEYMVKRTEIQLGNTVHYADSLPVAWPNLGPEIFSAFYDCEMEYGPDTAWSIPNLPDWSEASLAKIRLNTDNFYFRKIMEMTDALLEAGRGKFIVGYTDLHGGGDALAAFRDPQELLLDTIEHPEEVKRLCDRITADYLRVYDIFYEKLTAAGMPSTSWCNAVGRGKFYIPSNDFSCMISEQAFEELFLPGIIRECRHMDRCIYHLDGPQALRYLDRLLEIPEIQAIQWVPGAGHDYWADWIDVYQRIQNKHKALQLWGVPVKDLPQLCAALRPEGVWISYLSGIENEQEAQAALKQLAKWTKRQ